MVCWMAELGSGLRLLLLQVTNSFVVSHHLTHLSWAQIRQIKIKDQTGCLEF